MDSLLLTDIQVAELLGCSVAKVRADRFDDAPIIEYAEDEVRKKDRKIYSRVEAGELHPIDAAAEAGIDIPEMKGVRWAHYGRSVRYARADIEAYIEAHRRGSWRPQRRTGGAR